MVVCGSRKRLVLEDVLNAVEEYTVVAVEVLADGVDGDAPVGNAEIAQDWSGEDEWLFTDPEGDFGSVQEVSCFLSIWRKLVVPGDHLRFCGSYAIGTVAVTVHCVDVVTVRLRLC